MTPVQFSIMLAESRTAFRLEHQREPLAGELPAMQHWLAGNPTVPWDWQEWRGWLDLAWRHTSAGGSIGRVRLVDDPPTTYQQWSMSITPFHEKAGESILYLTCPEAEKLGIPADNWWLFDDAAVVMIDYDGVASPRRTLITDPAKIRRYRRWRDRAMSHASAAEAIPA